jgi:hypothetical protein
MTAVRHQDAEQRYPHRHLDIEGPVAARPGVRVSPWRDEAGEPEAEPAEDDSRAVRYEPDVGCRRAAAHPEFQRADPLTGPLTGTDYPGGKTDGTEGADPPLMGHETLGPANDAQPCRLPRGGHGQAHQPAQHPDRPGAPGVNVHNSGHGRGDSAGVKPAHPVITVRHRHPRMVTGGH